MVSSLPLAHIIDPKKEKSIKQRLLKNTTFTEDFRKRFICHLYFGSEIGRHKNGQSIIGKKTVLFEKSKTLGLVFFFFFFFLLWSTLIPNLFL